MRYVPILYFLCGLLYLDGTSLMFSPLRLASRISKDPDAAGPERQVTPSYVTGKGFSRRARRNGLKVW